jgi:hypothetical protein
MSRIPIIVLGAAVASLTGSAALVPAASSAHRAAHAGAARAVIADCFGRGASAPAGYVAACGDGNFALTGLRWIGWGGSRARATGFAVANDCRTSCARGRSHRYPATVVATHLTGGGAQRSYRLLIVTAGAHRPAGFPEVERIPLPAPRAGARNGAR